MPDGARGSLRPAPDFRGLIEAAVAAIREQMEARLADRDRQIAGLFAERQELQRLVADAQRAERIARDEAAELRAELSARRTWGLLRRLHWALGRRDNSVSARPRMPGGERRRPSQRRSWRPTTVPPARIALPWREGDKVHWRDRDGVYRRDVDTEHAEIVIADRGYRVRRDELR